MDEPLKPKNKGGRPLKPIDPELVKQLAAVHCTIDEIATRVGVSVMTLRTRFLDVITQGKDEGKISLKRKMFSVAMQGNVHMLIFLAKQHLGYRDKFPEEVSPTNIHVSVNEVPK